MKQINIIRKGENYSDIKFVFDFFDRFALKLKKVSLPEEKRTSQTMTFYDHYNDDVYYVNAKYINLILDYCYNEYFFKIVLSGSSYYQQVKKVCDGLKIEPYYYDLFFRSFFLAIKDRYNCSEKNDYFFTKNIVLRIVLRAHSDAFDELPKIDVETFQSKCKLILKKLEEVGLVSYYQNDITQNVRLRSYFPISCDTFKFEVTKEKKGFETSIAMFDFLDLKRFLDNSNKFDYNLLDRMDRCAHYLVIISFKNAKFYDNPYSDNSYIKKLTLEKNLIELEKKKNNA